MSKDDFPRIDYNPILRPLITMSGRNGNDKRPSLHTPPSPVFSFSRLTETKLTRGRL